MNFRWQLAQFLESRWWKRYLRGKDPETYLSEKRAYWSRFLAELGYEPAPGARALDAGCGPAGTFILLHDTQRFTATDPLLDRYEAELGIFSRAAYPRVTFRTETLESLAETAVYDVIYCCNAINHVADWSLALDRLAAALRPGGTLLLSSDVHRHAWLQPLFRMLPGDALHPQQHLPEAYRAAFAARGLTVERELVLRRELIFEYRVWRLKMSDW